MAIHQYPLSFIPRAVLLKTCGRIPQQLVPAGWREEWLPQDYDKVAVDIFEYEPEFDWWQKMISAVELTTAIHAIIPRTPETEYCTSILHFGDYSSHDASISLHADGEVESAGFRLDLTKDIGPLLQSIIVFCKQFDLLITGSYDEVLEAKMETLVSTINQSKPYKFVLNPQDYLTRLARD